MHFRVKKKHTDLQMCKVENIHQCWYTTWKHFYRNVSINSDLIKHYYRQYWLLQDAANENSPITSSKIRTVRQKYRISHFSALSRTVAVRYPRTTRDSKYLQRQWTPHSQNIIIDTVSMSARPCIFYASYQNQKFPNTPNRGQICHRATGNVLKRLETSRNVLKRSETS